MTIYIYPYKGGSNSVKALSTALNCKVLKLENSSFKDSPKKTIVNWGSTKLPYKLAKIFNLPNVVATAANKLEAFKKLTNSVPWTDDIGVARGWINDNKTVFCRTSLNGHSGQGIVIAETIEQLVPCPLYTMYIKKKREYRVHVFGEKVIHVQEKRKKKGVETDSKIRSHGNGWVFCTEGVEIDDICKQTAIDAVKSLGLHFGAVDIIYNEHYKKYYALEVNTAPGLEGQTILKYKDAINETN